MSCASAVTISRRLARFAFVPMALAVALTSGGCSSNDQMSLPAEIDDVGNADDTTDDHPAEPEDAGAAPDVAPVMDHGDAAVDGSAQACAVVQSPDAAYLKYGLHPDASDALQRLAFPAVRVTQTIGTAAASAGTHEQDGTAEGKPYSAATDISVSGMTDAQVAVFLDTLTEAGFVPFFRNPGHDGWPSTEARHIHMIWAGAKMKYSLRQQVRDWYAGKNGLASHTTYTFHKWSACWRTAIWQRFLTKNPATG